jgi:ubiquinone/menaquinone biosynthesis C-methylase UbiE
MNPFVKSLRLLADPTRLRLLLLLEREELSVAEIQEILGMGQSRISAHLAQLKRAGLLRDRRAGKNIYYGPAEGVRNGSLAQIHALVKAGAGEIPNAAADQSALKLLLKKRRDKARSYFDQLAGKFGRSYCPGRSWEALAHMLFSLLPPMVVADLGAGEGMLSQLLAKRAKKVIAVDSSENMVAFGRDLAKRHGFKNLEYRLGDIEEPPLDAGSVDLALFSQALHHAANPDRALAAAHRILKRGGRVVVLDLLAHSFEQARELYADSWLGFSEADLLRMLKAAGFRDVSVQTIAREPEAPHFQTVLALGMKE